MIVAGMACVPWRKETLPLSVESIARQVDRLNLYMSGWGDEALPPQVVRNKKVVVYRTEEDLGDAGKFIDVPTGCLYLSCDDDLLYLDGYADRFRWFIGQRMIGSFHGRVVIDSVEGREGYHHFSAVNKEVRFINCPGTGCCGFDTDKVRPKRSDFPTRNMADLYLGAFAQRYKIPVVLMRRPGKPFVQQLNWEARSIYTDRDRYKGDMERLISLTKPWKLYGNEADLSRGKTRPAPIPVGTPITVVKEGILVAQVSEVQVSEMRDGE